MKKQLLLLVMVLLPMLALAAEVEIDGLWYELGSKTKEATVVKYKNNNYYQGDIVIPETVKNEGEDYSVTSIGNFAFGDCSGLTSVTIPNSVTSIGWRTFFRCGGLTSIKIPNSLTSIGEDAFYQCSSLTTINIPNSVTSIMKYTFYECSSLISIKLPDSVKTIENGAFNGCSALTSINIPESLTNVGSAAFANCTNLESVYIKSIESWLSIKFEEEYSTPLRYGAKLFLNGVELTNLTISDGFSVINDFAFDGCYSLRTVIIPDGVTSIGTCAFRNCPELTSISLPESLTKIGAQAFQGCSNLTSFKIPNGVTNIDVGTFSGCSSLTSISIPDGLTAIGSNAFENCSSLTSIKMPDVLTTIGSWAFSGCSNLTSFTIPDGVKSIEGSVFQYCSGLTSIKIPNSITSIGGNAFCDCSSLTNINIPEGVIDIGDCAFSFCSSLTSFNVPDGVKTLSYRVFAECSSLTSINIPDGLVNIDYGAFYGCSALTSINLPESVTTIGTSAFEKCYSLSSITIFDGMHSIGNGAFRGCDHLSNVSIKSIESWLSIKFENEFSNPLRYGAKLFLNGVELTDLIIPDGISIINEFVFRNCISIKSLTFTEGVNIIKKDAFADCRNLESITISSTVEYIYQNAFANCTSLKRIIVLPLTPPFLFDNSFSDFSVPLKVPKGYKEAYQTAQGWKNFTNISDADKYRLTYIVDNVEYKLYEIEEGTAITPEPAPTKEGYTFSGWSEIPETMPAHDVNVTGTFSINKYTLTYMIDDAVYKTYEVEYGATITPEAAPTKEGYTFSGWSEIPETMPAHDVTVTGTFSINKYKLTYTVDGTEYKTYEVEYGATITPEAAPTKEGYTFSGWSEIPQTMPAHDVTVSGTFSINKYKLTYTIDGEEYKTYDIEYGATITPETAPTKEGYTFSGWSEIPETMPAHDVTVTGTFSVNSYKLTYMIDDKVYKETMYEYGATITPEPKPEGDYDTFEWKDLPETMPAHDVVVYASYTSGIIEVLMASLHNVRIYAPNGKRLNKLQKGLNIVILDDGTVKKVVVK